MGKQYEELGITDAFMFAKVMSNKEICKPVLEQILNIKIRDIEYLDYEETIQIAPGSKSIRLDIYVEDDKNTVFILEMQTTNYEELPKGSRYYQDIIDLNLKNYPSVKMIKRIEVFMNLRIYVLMIRI